MCSCLVIWVVVVHLKATSQAVFQKRICWNQLNQNGLIHIYGRKGLLSVSGHTRSIMELHTCCLDGSNILGIWDYNGTIISQSVRARRTTFVVAYVLKLHGQNPVPMSCIQKLTGMFQSQGYGCRKMANCNSAGFLTASFWGWNDFSACCPLMLIESQSYLGW